MVNQFELHPRRPCTELRRVCADSGVAVAAYASLGCGDLLAHPTVAKVAAELQCTPAQVGGMQLAGGGDHRVMPCAWCV